MNRKYISQRNMKVVMREPVKNWCTQQHTPWGVDYQMIMRHNYHNLIRGDVTALTLPY